LPAMFESEKMSMTLEVILEIISDNFCTKVARISATKVKFTEQIIYIYNIVRS